MLYAMIDNQKVQAEPYERGICPYCGGEVIAKCGEVYTWHWAHLTRANCYGGEETEWHRRWKSEFPMEYVEITIDRDGERHRADVLFPNGWAIELQHSPLAPEEVRARQEFYGEKLIWVVDLREQSKRDQICLYDRDAFYGFSYRRAKNMLRYMNLKNMFWDITVDDGYPYLILPRKVYEKTNTWFTGWGDIFWKKQFVRYLYGVGGMTSSMLAAYQKRKLENEKRIAEAKLQTRMSL